MPLTGHQAIVRTVCFNPVNDLVLLSGGQTDKDVKVWNSETGQQIASLKGHTGDSINSIKMAQDGSFAISVGSDKKVLLFDIRVSKAVGSIDA
jgi:WD40 repeat protein